MAQVKRNDYIYIYTIFQPKKEKKKQKQNADRQTWEWIENGQRLKGESFNHNGVWWFCFGGRAINVTHFDYVTPNVL